MQVLLNWTGAVEEGRRVVQGGWGRDADTSPVKVDDLTINGCIRRFGAFASCNPFRHPAVAHRINLHLGLLMAPVDGRAKNVHSSNKQYGQCVQSLSGSNQILAYRDNTGGKGCTFAAGCLSGALRRLLTLYKTHSICSRRAAAMPDQLTRELQVPGAAP